MDQQRHVGIVRSAYQHMIRHPAQHRAGGFGDTGFNAVNTGDLPGFRQRMDDVFTALLKLGFSCVRQIATGQGREIQSLTVLRDGIHQHAAAFELRQVIANHAAVQTVARPDRARNHAGHRRAHNAERDQPVIIAGGEPGFAARIGEYGQPGFFRVAGTVT